MIFNQNDGWRKLEEWTESQGIGLSDDSDKHYKKRIPDKDRVKELRRKQFKKGAA